MHKTNLYVKQFRMPSLESGLPSPQSVSQFDPSFCVSSDFFDSQPNHTHPQTIFVAHPHTYGSFSYFWKKTNRPNSSLVEELPEVFKKISHRCFWKVTYYAQTSLPMQEQLWIVTPSQQGRVVLKGASKANQRNMGEVFLQNLIVG